MLKPTTDAGITTGLSEAIEMLLPALEEFLRFEDKDLAASEFDQWHASLNKRLPERGRGAASDRDVPGWGVAPLLVDDSRKLRHRPRVPHRRAHR